MVKNFNMIIEQGEDGYLISEVVELPGCHTQAKTFDELVKRTKEAISLCLKSRKQQGRWSIDNVFEIFPNLRERQNVAGGLISGGEKQMLTICRTLMGDPDFIMIDEPTEGLAPMLVEQMGQLIEEIAQREVSVLLVEQKLSIALKISKRLYIMGHGRIVFEGRPEDLRTDQSIRKEWLEV